MKLAPIIDALRDRCPTFEARVFGLAEFEDVLAAPETDLPACFVIPDSDDVISTAHLHVPQVELHENVALVAALPQKDPRGQGAFDAVHEIRTEILAAILGWAPDACTGPLIYAGGEPVHSNRVRFMYRFEFYTRTMIDAEFDGFQPPLEDLGEVGFGGDVIDPAADPNLAYPGPDGRIEFGADVTIETAT